MDAIRDEAWDARFNEYIEYAKARLAGQVSSTKQDGWLKSCVSSHKRGRLSKYKSDKLTQALGEDWVLGPKIIRWMVNASIDNLLSITNVVKKDNEVYFDNCPTYICNAPAIVTLTADAEVFKVNPSVWSSKYEKWIPDGDYLSAEGKAEYWEPDHSGQWFATEISYNELFSKYFQATMVLEGTKVTITEPGRYYAVIYNDEDYGENIDLTDAVIIIQDTPTTATNETTTPTNAKVMVDDSNVNFDAYNINGNNYFKLRDLAEVLDGTKKQFEVSWAASKNAINLTSGKSYTSVGGELATESATAATATATNSSIYIDGDQVDLIAYNINGNNYFKLMDIGEVFDFGVFWNGSSKTINIDTSTGYSE